MTPGLCLLADMNISPRTVEVLRKHGWEALKFAADCGTTG